MSTEYELLDQANESITQYGRHRDINRLASSYRDIKRILITASHGGSLQLLKLALDVSKSAKKYIPDNRALAEQLAIAYCTEFESDPEIFNLIPEPSKEQFDKAIDYYVNNNTIKDISQLGSTIEKMAVAQYYEPLGKLIDWMMTAGRSLCNEQQRYFMIDTAGVLNRLGKCLPWQELAESEKGLSQKLESLTGFMDALEKHKLQLDALYSTDEMPLHLANWVTPKVIVALANLGYMDHAENMYHARAMNHEEGDLTVFMVSKGLKAPSYLVYGKLHECYDSGSGAYPHNAIVMHLSSGGRLADCLEFEGYGGVTVAKHIGRQIKIYGPKYPDVCVALIDKFLAFNESTGLAASGLPRCILERRPELAEEDLGASLGL